MAGVAGCRGGSGGGGGAAKPSVAAAPALVITQAEAEKVFSAYEWERRTAADWKDAESVVRVTTGALWAERKADAALRRATGDHSRRVAGLVAPSFAVFSKPEWRDDGQATAVESWLPMAEPVLLDSGDVWPFAGVKVQVRAAPVAAVRRDAAGAAVLSPTAAADGGVRPVRGLPELHGAGRETGEHGVRAGAADRRGGGVQLPHAAAAGGGGG
ncbi:hypothetical protein [Streptomyces sp. NPDC090022]|uniref:hypothetical protein n=1 Tax=Streptomyces sp. NPDC090022 TaxID=3365920 RepID=UPI003811F2B5